MCDIVGIDLGTSNSCVAAIINGKIEVIQDKHGKRLTPSYVAFDDDQILVGRHARDLPASTLSKNTVYETKRLIGQHFNDPKVQKDIQNFTYDIFDDCGAPKIKITNDQEPNGMYPEEISAYILEYLKLIAESRLKKKISKAVITIPVYFENSQKQATIDASKIAGFEEVTIITEPIAAALAYTYEQNKTFSGHILIYDFGGGTFDVSIVSYKNGISKVKATDGDSHLGGKDFDDELVNYIKTHCKVSLSNRDDLRRLKQKCEKCKKRLSNSERERFELNYINGTQDIDTILSRGIFENLIRKTVEKTITIVEKCLRDSNVKKWEIDEVVIVGGSTRVPLVRRLLIEFFEGKKLNVTLNPDEAVAYGAAVYAGSISANKDVLEDVAPIETCAITNLSTQKDLLEDVAPLPIKTDVIGGLLQLNTSIANEFSRTWSPDTAKTNFPPDVQSMLDVGGESNSIEGAVTKGINKFGRPEKNVEDYLQRYDFEESKRNFADFLQTFIEKVETLPDLEARNRLMKLSTDAKEWCNTLSIGDVEELEFKKEWLTVQFNKYSSRNQPDRKKICSLM